MAFEIKGYMMLLLEKLFKKTKPVLAIVDDSIPNAKPMGFRNYEFNLILDNVPGACIWTMSRTKPGNDAFFHHCYGQTKTDFKKNKKQYLQFFPENKNRVYWVNTKGKYKCNLAYSIFLCTTYTLLPFYEKNKIPFVFVLYPGGGFGLDNTSSDMMLKKICSSPYFRGVICTQPVTRDYLLKKEFCAPDRIYYEFGVYIQFRPDDIPPKQYFQKDKQTLDICFVAAKYSERGIDKGYDLFIDVAKQLVQKYPFVRFHVVGGFDETDISIDGLEGKIKFYGFLQAHELSTFYPKMDICLSPNRPFKLFPGNFDGFPLAGEAMCFGVVLMATDELNNNQGYYIDGQELIVIRPDIEDIISKIEPLIESPDVLYAIGRNGATKIFNIKNPKQRADRIIQILKENLKENE